MRNDDMQTYLAKTALSVGVLLTMSTLAPANGKLQESSVRLTIVNPTGLYDPAPNGYSHVIVAKGRAHIAFIAGQGGEDQEGALSPRFADQVKQTCVRR